MNTAAPREERTPVGILLMALAVVFFTCIDTTAKWLILAGLPALQVVFARYLGHFIFALVFFTARQGTAAFRTQSPGQQALRSVFLMTSTICNFIALQYLPITVTTTIMFAGPIVITLLAIPLLGEQVGIRRILAVCVGFIGVIVVMRPWGTGFHPAMLLNVVALTLASLYFIMTRRMAGKESNSSQQLWASGLATLVLLPVVLPLWTWPEGSVWIGFCIIGPFGAFAHISATTAHRLADASILAPVIYIQIFLAALAGVLVFNTWPTIWTLAGGLIIVASGLYIWHRERVKTV
ncbi:MAG: DMT family transporter [Pelagimonas sp.]|uniref:DMT family transporter n=1 Tax=Pelagimonas sp. TaxID=2073170 RepID=UPI003D6B8DA6